MSHNNQPRAKILARGWGAWCIFRWPSGALDCGAPRRPFGAARCGCPAGLGAAVCRGALRTRRTPRQPYAYSTLMVFVLPLRPLMMPPVMMTLSPFSSCITCRLTCSAW